MKDTKEDRTCHVCRRVVVADDRPQRRRYMHVPWSGPKKRLVICGGDEKGPGPDGKEADVCLGIFQTLQLVSFGARSLPEITMKFAS